MSSRQQKGQSQQMPTNPADLLNIVQQMSKNMSAKDKSDLSKIDINSMIGTVMAGMMPGKQINPAMQNEIKKVTENVMKSFVSNAEEETVEPVHLEGSKISLEIPISDVGQNPPISNVGQNPPTSFDTFYRVPAPKDIKEPVSTDAFELLDDDASVDEFNPRTDDITIKLDVSLQELYNGTSKKIAIQRSRFKKDASGQDILIQEKRKIMVPIARGTRDEQCIRYSKQSDEMAGHDTGDIVVIVKQNGHPYFEREREHIFLSKKISLFESYAAAKGLISITVVTLDGRLLKLDSCGIPLHLNDGLKKVTGEGMKTPDGKSGDLFIRFHLILPDVDKIDVSYVSKLKNIFPPVNNDIIYTDPTVKDGLDISSLNNVCPRSLEDVSESDLEDLNIDEDDEEDEEYEDEDPDDEDQEDQEDDDDEEHHKHSEKCNHDERSSSEKSSDHGRREIQTRRRH